MRRRRASVPAENPILFLRVLASEHAGGEIVSMGLDALRAVLDEFDRASVERDLPKSSRRGAIT